MNRGSLLFCAFVCAACGGAATTETTATGGGSASNETATPTETAGAEAPEAGSEATMVLPLSAIPECDGYLRFYERCEPTLAPEIAAGDRRGFAAERGWIEYLAGTPEGAGLPSACSQMTRELQAVCP